MDFNTEIEKIISEYKNKGCFTSSSIGVYVKNNKQHDYKFVTSENIKNNKQTTNNKKHIYYDLASLTKPLVTVLSILSLKKERKISIKDTLSGVFTGRDVPQDKRDISIEQLLSHSSGFPDHRHYYRDLAGMAVGSRREALFKLIMGEELAYPPGNDFIYSDLGYLLLGLMIEEKAGMALDRYFNGKILSPAILSGRLFFNRHDTESITPEDYAPTDDCPWRGKIMAGEVSDENCWVLGGVAGHAGLFGDIVGVTGLVALILDIWKNRASHPNIDGEDLAAMLIKRDMPPGNTWALGFDTPTPGCSSSGQYLSRTSVGHLGFTGTSFWIDPERDLAIVVLTNRVHPLRQNELIRDFRPLVHDRIVELLGVAVG